VLDAACKYPWGVRDAPAPRGRHGDGLPRAVRKFGVYDDDRPVFDWMRGQVPPGVTCVEAQLMDFADDVAYSVHDVEDGIVAGRVQLSSLTDAGLRAAIWETACDWYAPGLGFDEFDAAYARLAALRSWPDAPYDGSRAQLAGLKNLTSRLINRFCRGVQDEVARRQLPRTLVRYTADLPIPADVSTEIVVLKAVAAHLVMKTDDRVAEHSRQRELLTELVSAYAEAGTDALEPVFRADFEQAADEGTRLRVVIDQVASLTDPSAVQKHAALVRTA
jgi:dGTPase